MPTPRKPTLLKILQGNPGKRALPNNEPQPEVGATPPKWLRGDALEEWREIAPQLEELGTLRKTDATALGIYCSLVAAFRRHDSDGNTSARTAGEIRQYLARFGLTPADRSRVQGKPKEQPKKLDRFTGTRS